MRCKVFITALFFLQTSTAFSENFFRKALNTANDFVEAFNDYDTIYIEPNHYNFAAMVQGTQSMERYRIKIDKNMTVTLGPDLNPRIGPYFGWRWLFLGYALDVNLGRMSDERNMRKDFKASIYTSLFGLDVFFRNTGNYYRIKSIDVGHNVSTNELRNLNFDGIEIGTSGFNLYYVFNHKHFSYPAAYSQSTQQKRSCGSFLAGLGYTHHSLDFNHQKMDTLLIQHGYDPLLLDSTQHVNGVKYNDLNFSIGYSYNLVFAKNFLANATLSAALAIDKATGEYENTKEKRWLEKTFFTLDDINVDGIARLAVLWNNGRWFAGASAIFHTYTYRKEHFSTLNIFGDFNLYFGFNFLRRTNKK